MNLKFVSTNEQKFEEFRSILGLENLELSTYSFREHQDSDIHEIVLDKLKKAKEVLGAAPFFVEHSGIEIDGFNQLPGGLTGIFMKKLKPIGICRMLSDYSDDERNARAISVIGFSYGENMRKFQGTSEGKISKSLRESNNFSWHWDSIFIPDDGGGKTYSEMGFDKKNELSMRKKAADRFRDFLKKNDSLKELLIPKSFNEDLIKKFNEEKPDIDKLEKLIREDRIDECLTEVIFLKESPVRDEARLLQNQWVRLNKEINLGMISPTVKTNEQSRIVLALIKLIGRL